MGVNEMAVWLLCSIPALSVAVDKWYSPRLLSRWSKRAAYLSILALCEIKILLAGNSFTLKLSITHWRVFTSSWFSPLATFPDSFSVDFGIWFWNFPIGFGILNWLHNPFSNLSQRSRVTWHHMSLTTYIAVFWTSYSLQVHLKIAHSSHMSTSHNCELVAKHLKWGHMTIMGGHFIMARIALWATKHPFCGRCNSYWMTGHK